MTTFKEVKIGQAFLSNGNTAVKKSSRTALIVGAGRVFYWGYKESVKVVA